MATRGWLLTIHLNGTSGLPTRLVGNWRNKLGLLPPPGGRHSHAGTWTVRAESGSVSYCLSGDLHRCGFVILCRLLPLGRQHLTWLLPPACCSRCTLPTRWLQHGWLAMDRCWSRSGRFCKCVIAVASLHRGESQSCEAPAGPPSLLRAGNAKPGERCDAGAHPGHL